MSRRANTVSLSRLITSHLIPRRLGVRHLLSGTAAGLGPAFASAPVMPRLYLPSGFGVFNVISAVTLALTTLFAPRLNLAAPLPGDPREAKSTATLAQIVKRR